MNDRWSAFRHDHTAIRVARNHIDRAFELGGDRNANGTQFYAECSCKGFRCSPLADPGGSGGIPKERHALHPWRDLLEKFQPFPGGIIINRSETGGIAAWSREALDHTGA